MHLRIIDHIVETVGTVHQHCRIIARQDPDLSKQLKRAINSVGLNAGEGLCAGSFSTCIGRRSWSTRTSA